MDDLFDHQRTEGGRFLCSKDHPMPKDAPVHSRWVHEDAEVVGSSHDGAADDFACPRCGVTWRNWYDDNSF